TEVVEYLSRRYGMPVIALGDIVREYATQEALPATREHLHDVSARYAKRCGADFFARQALARAERISDPAITVTGIRTPADVVSFRRLLGNEFVLIHVVTSEHRRRYEHLRA